VVSAARGCDQGSAGDVRDDGRQYLLVAASGTGPDGTVDPKNPLAEDLPKGYVAFALPAR
jgi:hypothetical protein